MSKYIYRRLSSDERAEIVRQRCEKGFPLHAPPHPFRQAGTYAISAANFEHAPIMASTQRRTAFEADLLEALAQIGADVTGWVILPNHYHFIAGVQSLNDISAALQHLHGRTARDWNLMDGLTGQRKVWYKFYDRMIRDEHHFFKALNYIHYNPVKHGYVENVYEWPWTSLHNYDELQGREWLREKWREFPGDATIGVDFQE